MSKKFQLCYNDVFPTRSATLVPLFSPQRTGGVHEPEAVGGQGSVGGVGAGHQAPLEHPAHVHRFLFNFFIYKFT